MRLLEIPAERYARDVLPLTAPLWAGRRTFDEYVAQTLELARSRYGRRHYRTIGLYDGKRLVASFKRDYVYVNDCESADSVLSLLPSWFADYNEQAPHSALAMRSPREYRRALNLVGDCQLKWGPDQGIEASATTG